MEELEVKIQKLIDMFNAAHDEYILLIVDMLSVEYGEEVHVESMTTMLNRIDSITRTLRNNLRSAVDDIVETAWRLGYTTAQEELGDYSEITYSDNQQEMLEVLKRDTYNDMLVATNYMSESAKKFVRTKTSQIMQLQQANREGQKQLAYALARQLESGKLSKDASKYGFTGIVDRAGRKWRLNTYCEMVVRTKTTQAHIYATAEQAKELGCNLFIISSHNAIDACSKWEGAIITVGEQSDEYPSYEELRDSGDIFHPNCKHHITPVSNRMADRITASYM